MTLNEKNWKIINDIIGDYCKRSTKWRQWGTGIQQIISTSIQKHLISQSPERIPIRLVKNNWEEIINIIEIVCRYKGRKWVIWSEYIIQTIQITINSTKAELSTTQRINNYASNKSSKDTTKSNRAYSGESMKKFFEPQTLWKVLLIIGFLTGFLVSGIQGLACASNNDSICEISAEISYIFMVPFGISLLIWMFSGWAGIFLLRKKGYFANIRNFGFIGVVLFLLIGWWLFVIIWELVGLAGALFYLYAGKKPSKPRCPRCRSWNELGATKCKFCTADIPLT